ncbi:hypothetical protein AAFP30_01905 [Gordonia sp. CPCC 205515]|uniref:hypothetical protein n=1 Tax=Gordonia sp. CPCC 205515 TaxID=3140791 RepID=UPI003AF3B863
MNRRPAALLRITVAIVAVLLLIIGIGAILWKLGVDPVQTWINRIDQRAGQTATEQSWWPAVLVAVALVALIWGWCLIATVIRPGKTDDVLLADSGPGGQMTVPPKLIADAVGADLAAAPELDRVSSKATDDRGRTIIRMTVTADPTRSYAEIASVVGDAVEHVRGALDGSDTHVQAMVHLEPRAG